MKIQIIGSAAPSNHYNIWIDANRCEDICIHRTFLKRSIPTVPV